MVTLFWSCATFLVYTFFGYALLVFLLSAFRKRNHRRQPIEPPITVIIAAYNEEGVIGEKIENTLQLDYPAEWREILVASDGSTDGTAAIVRSFAGRGVRLVELPERRGKHYAQMVARDASQGDIMVFTDASVQLEPHALRALVSNFADPAVGCASSVDRILPEKVGLGEVFYVGFEMWLRDLESRVGSLVSASGSFFAARRELGEPWHWEQSSDFFLPLHAAERGLRTVVDWECVGHYGVVRSSRGEFQRKIRTIVHGLDVLFTHARLLNPFRYRFFSVQLMSHKLFRWLTPFALLLLFVANLFLREHGPFYQWTLWLQVAVYGGGLLALLLSRLVDSKLMRLMSFFLLGNAATIMAWVKFGSGEKFVFWQPTRRE